VTFDATPGVTHTVVGYTGGSNPRPTYESVCAGDGHTEAIKIEYDPKQVSYEQLLDTFYAGCPADSRGRTQYKSAVWVHGEEQRRVAEQTAQKKGKADRLQIIDAQDWHNAEDYHQKYVKKGGGCATQ
jgi:peptide-methionine (S)-S-oxide reductase